MSDPPALIVRFVTTGLAFRETGPAIIMLLPEGGTIPPVHVEAEFHNPPATVEVKVVWAVTCIPHALIRNKHVQYRNFLPVTNSIFIISDF
jgi:hypothetical protein